MNPFALRLKVFFALALALAAHAFATDSVANDPEGMFIYHFSGAAMDAMLCLVVTFSLAGTRGRIMHDLMLASIITNVAGWILYMAWVGPIYYNVAMWSLSAAQVACLFFPDRHAARVRAFSPFAFFHARTQPQ